MDVLLLGLAFDICQMLANLFQVLFDFFLELSQLTINIIDISDLTKNIYIILSVVMIFYISFNILTYLIDPNKFIGNNSSGSKFLISIVVSIALLVLTPAIFQILTDFQTALLNPKDNILGRIILSQGPNKGYTNEEFNSVGSQIVRTVFKATLTPVDPENTTLEEDPYFSMNYNSLGNLKNYAEKFNEYNFNWGMTAITFILLSIVLLNFLFDIAIRIFKLLFMRIIAPIPILSYSLPKKDIFNKWVRITLSSYASLFIRLIIIYFAVFCIIELNLSEATSDNVMINLFLIIGVLLFAKQLPTLISEITGIKSEGNFSINPMARIREVPLFGSAVQTAGAAVGGLATGTALGFRAAGGFKGIAQGFKDKGLVGGAQKIATIGKSASLGSVYGARAGFNQTKLMGVAAKNQKVDKTAYTAGSSAVAQAITGNSNASSGVIDRVFNNIGTELNRPTHDQKDIIDKADKAYNEQVQNLSVLRDSQREIKSNMEVNIARRNNLQLQLNTIDNDITTVTGSRESRIQTETAAIDSQISNITAGRNQAVANATSSIEAQITQAKDKLRNALSTANAQEVSTYKQQIQNLQQQKVQVEQQIDTQIQQQIQTLQNQKTTVAQRVDTQIRQEVETLQQQRTTVERQYSEANAVANDYTKQYGDITARIDGGTITNAQGVQEHINGAVNDVAAAKANVKVEKDKLKAMNGPYQKNE